MLKTHFTQLILRHSTDSTIADSLWTELVRRYTAAERYYHTLSHIEAVIAGLNEVRSLIRDWDTVLFAVYYHDIIYNATAADNEQQSAALAAKRLAALGYPEDGIALCIAMILATKEHRKSEDVDTDFVTDADLSILGQRPDIYKQYTENIRKEYAMFPALLYKAGRKSVLRNLLAMDRVYKTAHFYHKYEAQARQNLEQELLQL